MKSRFCYLVPLLFFCQSLIAQNDEYRLEYHRSGGLNPQINPSPVPETSGNSGTGANINVVYHRINWTINPNSGSKTITGSITTYFKTILPNVASLSFDLNKASFNNGSLTVTYHGTGCTKTFPTSGNVNILNITLPSTIAASNTLDSIVINYSGIPPGVVGAAEGYQKGTYTDQSSVTQNYTMSLSESYEDRDWWPCKADMQDKIDSMDINVTVPWSTPDTFWVATNGVLIDSAISGANRTFKFKTRYPIPSYLVCVSVAKFNRYYRTVNINGTIVPVVYNLLGGKAASYYTNAVTAMDKINPVVLAFSNKFGDYPFKNEKHGFYDGLLGAGGMEHQTFSGIASGSLTSLSTLAHELMHQWFGDNVTFSTWNDLWLAEGFARYSEALSAELVPSLGLNPYTIRNSIKTTALGLNAQSAWIPNSSMGTSDLIWNTNYGQTVYDRGAMIVSMLRAICGDSKFYQALTNYQTALAGKSATSDTLKNYFNAILGRDISGFFDDYVGGSGSGSQVGGIGNPVNPVNWNSPAANQLVIQMGTQTRTSGSNVSYFNGPVVLHVTNAATGWTKDTTIVFYDWGSGNLSYAGNGLSAPVGGNILNYTLSFTPTNVFFDDSARTLSTGSATKSSTLVGYVWSGTTSSAWNTSSNWSGCCGVPPTNAEVTIATTGSQPVLPGPITVSSITINGANTVTIGSNILTVNAAVKGTGTFTGSLSSGLTINGAAGTLSFTQTSAATRSLNAFTLNSGSSAKLGNALEVTGPITLNPSSSLTINTGISLLVK